MPARVPCTDFCGETRGAIGVRPNCEPMKNPKTSYATVQITTPSTRPTPSSNPSKSPAKPPSPPMYANARTVVATPITGRPGVISSKNHNSETMTIIAK